MEKKPIVTKEKIEELVQKYPTPIHIYDEKVIVRAIRRQLARVFRSLHG